METLVSGLMPVLHSTATMRVAVDFQSSSTTTPDFVRDCLEILRSRGLDVHEQTLETVAGTQVIPTCLLSDIPTPGAACALGELVAEHAKTGIPTVLYMPWQGVDKKQRFQRATRTSCVALLRSRGAIVTADPEVWVECVLLLASYGLPSGPQVAIVAPPHTWLAAAAAAQQQRAGRLGQRFTPINHKPDSLAATDIVLTDAAFLETSPPTSDSLIIPVAGYPGLCAGKPRLVGIANALRAAALCGHASMRITAGDGPAPDIFSGKHNPVDRDRFVRQLDKLRDRVGDHECKVLLSSYGVAITRQAVATTPSAATRIAKKAGYPVEVKAWGPEQSSELDGCPVVSGITTASEVRRAFSAVCSDANCEAVIVRETPPIGREIHLSVRREDTLGLIVFLHQAGHIEPAAAIAPLRDVDAQAMARHVISSRSSDLDPDWDALSDLLIRVSHLVADNDRVISLELSRVVVGQTGEGATVIDARAELTSR